MGEREKPVWTPMETNKDSSRDYVQIFSPRIVLDKECETSWIFTNSPMEECLNNVQPDIFGPSLIKKIKNLQQEGIDLGIIKQPKPSPEEEAEYNQDR